MVEMFVCFHGIVIFFIFYLDIMIVKSFFYSHKIKNWRNCLNG